MRPKAPPVWMKTGAALLRAAAAQRDGGADRKEVRPLSGRMLRVHGRIDQGLFIAVVLSGGDELDLRAEEPVEEKVSVARGSELRRSENQPNAQAKPGADRG